MTNIQPTNNDKQYLWSYGAGAFLPLMQAGITAAIVTIAAWVIGALVFGWLDPHKPAIALGTLTLVWRWWVLQGHWFALTTAELITNYDINNDGMIGSAEQVEAEDEAPRVIRIQLIKDNGHVSDMIDLPASEAQLSALASGVLNGMPFSERMWTGKGKPFSTESFRKLKDAMLKRDLAEYINEEEPRQGIRLTEAGRAVMQEFALPHSPTAESAG